MTFPLPLKIVGVGGVERGDKALRLGTGRGCRWAVWC